MAVDAVTSMDFCHGGGRVGCGTQGVRVRKCAAKLDAVLVPVPSQHTLHLNKQREADIKCNDKYLNVLSYM